VIGAVVWVTGLPSSGKSTFATALHDALEGHGVPSVVLDSDSVREALVPAPGYGDVERAEFYETLARLAALVAKQNLIVIVPATANRRVFRERARELAPRFIEVWLDVSVRECRQRDSKGLYELGERGGVTHLPGADAVYEQPTAAEVVAEGGTDSIAIQRTLTLLVA
jgi:adenylylsulfate kinase